mgnify:FL=1
MKTLDIIVPVFNEESCINETIKRLENVRENLNSELDVNFVFVNDGSKDETANIIATYGQNNKYVKLINFSRNFGHQIAVTAGLDNTNADYVAIIDADLQDPPELIIDMYNKTKDGYDIVYGKRLKRENETAFKKFTAFAFYRVLNYMCDIDIPKDTGDFRLITKPVVDTLKNMPEHHRFIRGMVPWTGFKSTPIMFNRDERFAGETKYPLSKMLKLASNAIFSFSTKPLKVFYVIGILLLFLAILNISNVYLTSLFLVGALQLFGMGLLGEYLGRIFDDVKDRPLYVVKNKINL